MDSGRPTIPSRYATIGPGDVDGLASAEGADGFGELAGAKAGAPMAMVRTASTPTRASTTARSREVIRSDTDAPRSRPSGPRGRARHPISGSRRRCEGVGDEREEHEQDAQR